MPTPAPFSLTSPPSGAAALLAAALLLPVGAMAQGAQDGAAADTATLETALATLDLREIGPAAMGGRVADLAVVADDPSTFYVGYASGGLWRTENHGATWTPVFDEQPTASIGAVAVAPSNPNVVWVGTGEPQNRQSSPYGAGVFRSLDAGESWDFVGLEETRHVGRIVVHPSDPDVAWVAAVGHLWGPNEERGVFRTDDGGESWEKVLYIDEHTGAIDLVMDPEDPRTLFAATYQRRRTPWGFSADGPGSGIWRTLDGGETWEELTEGLPEGDKGRIGLDVYDGDGDLVYAVVQSRGEGRGVYRSTDRGGSWEKMSGRNPRPMYFSLVRIDPSNPERIYLGGVRFSISDDGGRTWWEGEAAPGVHLDHHAVWVNPHDPDHVLTGNDGGVAVSRDGGENWRHIHNVAAGQFYQIDLDSRDPYWVCGGLQDNNTWCGPNRTLTDEGRMTKSGPRNRHWVRIWGGDGFWAQIDPTDPDIIYAESQNGRFGRYHAETGEAASLQPTDRPTADEEDPEYRWHWNTPLHLSVHDPATVYAGANHLLRSRDRGHSWEEASPDLTRRIDRDTLPIMGMPVDSTTLSRHDGVSDYGTISEIGESPLDPEVLYAGTDDGKLHVSRDGGATWTDLTEGVPGLRTGMWVSGIEPSHHEPGRVYLAFDGHKADDYAPYVLVSEDFGETWRSITEGLPDDAAVNVIREHHDTPALLFVGNEIGVWVSVDGGEAWTRLTGTFPTVPVDDIRIHPRDNDLVLGTHGRSIWVLDDIAFLEGMARGEVLEDDAAVFETRATQWVLRGGPWFVAGEFIGDNPPEGALIRTWLRVGQDDPATLEILDGEAVVRTLEAPGTAGMGQVVWDFRTDREEPGDGDGPRVLPGSYTARLVGATDNATARLEVRQDPREEAPRAVLVERQEALERLDALDRTVDAAEDAMDEAEERLETARAVLEEAGGEDSQLMAEADSLTARLERAAEALDEADASGMAGSIARIRARPTADQMWRLQRSEEEVPETIAEINELLQALSAFEGRIYQDEARPEPLGPVGGAAGPARQE